jgi:4-hydroxy-2-oxoheptanedioate aldolase
VIDRSPLRVLTVEFLDPSLVEFATTLGYDVLTIDAEHGPVDRGLADLVRAAELGGMPALLRTLPDNPLLPAYLDVGFDGVHLANATDVAQVDAVADALKFRPLGRRGAGKGRISRYGALTQDGAFAERVNDETMLFVAIETPEGVANAAALAAHPAVDVVLAGTSDLSHSLGVPGQREHASVLDAVTAIRDATAAAGKRFGLPYAGPDDAVRALSRGASVLIASLAGVLAAGAAADRPHA